MLYMIGGRGTRPCFAGPEPEYDGVSRPTNLNRYILGSRPFPGQSMLWRIFRSFEDLKTLIMSYSSLITLYRSSPMESRLDRSHGCREA